MAYYYVDTNGQVFQGIYKQGQPIQLDIPVNYLTPDATAQHSIRMPFSLVLTSVEPGDECPFRLCIMMPDIYLYSTLEEKEFQDLLLSRPVHQHNTYELIYLRDGEFYQQIETQRHKYSKGSCCLLNRNIQHKEDYTTPFTMVELSLSPDFLNQLLDPSSRYFQKEPITDIHERLSNFFSEELQMHQESRKSYIDFIPKQDIPQAQDKIHKLFDQIAELMILPPPGASFLLQGLICQILYHLCDSDRYTTTPINLGTKTESKVFAQITKLMETQQGRVSREEIARELNYSGNYINRIVHKYTGMNLFQYGTAITMSRASWLLLHTNKSVTEIMSELQFTDRTHFYKLFRQHFHMTPKEYRDQHR